MVGRSQDGEAARRTYDKQVSNGVKGFYGYYWPEDLAKVTGYDDNEAIIRPKELPPIAPFLRGLRSVVLACRVVPGQLRAEIKADGQSWCFQCGQDPRC